METINFEASPVPVNVAAKVLKMDANRVRNLIETGKLPIGICIPPEKGKKNRNVYISPKLFYEFTGYVYKSE